MAAFGRRFVMSVFLVLALVLPAGCALTGHPRAAPRAAQLPRERLRAGLPVSASRPFPRVFQALVTSVSDGDTVHASIGGREERVRLIGVNAPEISRPGLGIREQPYGREAKEYTARHLLGKKVWLEFDVRERDRYGRLLAYVWLEEPSSGDADEVRSKMFNARLVLDGYAQVIIVPPNVKYAGLFRKFHREAREAGKGMW